MLDDAPVQNCLYINSLPMVFASVSLPLYRNTDERAFTLRFGSCDKLPMSVSVIPSERYSTSGLPLSFTNGITAIDLIAAIAVRPRR